MPSASLISDQLPNSGLGTPKCRGGISASVVLLKYKPTLTEVDKEESPILPQTLKLPQIELRKENSPLMSRKPSEPSCPPKKVFFSMKTFTPNYKHRHLEATPSTNNSSSLFNSFDDALKNSCEGKSLQTTRSTQNLLASKPHGAGTSHATPKLRIRWTKKYDPEIQLKHIILSDEFAEGFAYKMDEYFFKPILKKSNKMRYLPFSKLNKAERRLAASQKTVRFYL